MYEKIAAESWKADLAEFREKTDQFYQGEFDKNKYKGFSGGFGSYSQKGGKASMLRLRMTAGCLTKEKLAFVAGAMEKYGVDKAKLTTCETIQLHDLTPPALYDIMEEALDYEIVTRGGGGDFPRNVMMSPLSGVEVGEYFDVKPYAEAAADYMMTFIKGEKLPRKLKVGFSNGPANAPHATYRDLGFVAREDGKFDVYSAGGLGNNPRFGVKVAEAVDPSQVLYYVQAMRDTFIAHGNYENRGRARSRFMQDTLGVEGYVAAFGEKLQAAYEAMGDSLTLAVEPAAVLKTGDGSKAEGPRVIPQKQEGLYAVSYHPIGGVMNRAQMVKLYETVKEIEGTEVRIAPYETVYVINLTGAEAMQVAAALDDGAKTLFEHSVSCIGAAVCQVGVRDSQKLLADCIAAVREAKIADGALPQIHISGCPSSCGTHQTGDIGFHGGVKLVDKVPQPAFTLHVNGCELQGQEKLGEQLGVMLEEQIPAFLVELGQTVMAAGLSYAEWNAADPEAFKALAAKYLA